MNVPSNPSDRLPEPGEMVEATEDMLKERLAVREELIEAINREFLSRMTTWEVVGTYLSIMKFVRRYEEMWSGRGES